MTAVVESHDLVIEAGKLLLTTRAHTQNEDFERLGRLRGSVEASEEGAVLEEAAVKLIKAALLHSGLSMRIPLAPLSEFSVRTAYSGLAEGFGPCLAGQTAEQRARGLSWLHLVVSAPIIMWLTRVVRSCQTAITTASVALALLAEEGRNWEPLLERHGLSLWDLELVLRMHQSQAIVVALHGELSPEEKEGYMHILFTNVTCVSKKDPSNPRNVVTFAAFWQDHELACRLFEIVVSEADDRGDPQIGSMMRWHLCRMIMLGGKGKTFKVAEVLKLVKEARTALEQAAEWGADNSLTPAKEPETYWPCLGFAARCKAAIKADPSYAQSMVDAFESREVLDREKRHVMCAQCEKLCDKLQKCSACKLVGYCSKSCQVQDWKAGHKRACSERQTLARREL